MTPAHILSRRHDGVTFTSWPALSQTGIHKGWVITAHSDDPTLYDGQYVRAVGFCYINAQGNYGWRRKRDAKAALLSAIAEGRLGPQWPADRQPAKGV